MLKYQIKKIKNYIFKVLVRNIIESNPALFVRIQKYRYRNNPRRAQVVSPQSDVVIEGYPRSANSFSTRAFIQAQKPKEYDVANHIHSFAQIKHGIHIGKPTIVLLRKPYDAVKSLGAHRLQVLNFREENFNNYLKAWDIAWDIQYYIRFYQALLPYKDKVVIAPFEEVVNDFGKTIERLNKKFDTNFKVFEHTDDNVQKIFENSWFHLSPSKEREQYKKTIEELLETEYCQQLLEKANKVYQQYVA
jgi:hypothetical protein